MVAKGYGTEEERDSKVCKGLILSNKLLSRQIGSMTPKDLENSSYLFSRIADVGDFRKNYPLIYSELTKKREDIIEDNYGSVLDLSRRIVGRMEETEDQRRLIRFSKLFDKIGTPLEFVTIWQYALVDGRRQEIMAERVYKLSSFVKSTSSQTQ